MTSVPNSETMTLTKVFILTTDWASFLNTSWKPKISMKNKSWNKNDWGKDTIASIIGICWNRNFLMDNLATNLNGDSSLLRIKMIRICLTWWIHNNKEALLMRFSKILCLRSGLITKFLKVKSSKVSKRNSLKWPNRPQSNNSKKSFLICPNIPIKKTMFELIFTSTLYRR